MWECTLDNGFGQVNQVYNACKSTLDELNKLQNDELFVSIDVTVNSKHVEKEVNEWIFENNIVAKWQIFNFSISNTEVKLSITGFKFRNKEDAMAFKLRWL